MGEAGSADGEIVVETATSRFEVDRALDIAEAVWGWRPISDPMMRALEFAGCYVSTARRAGDPEPLGMCAGFVGVHGTELHLHSHLAAVLPEARGAGVGRALKRHQRDWCLDHAITHVSWTFDPLVVENARFNLHHLGAEGQRYLVDLYGAMDDDINHGDETDRLLVHWDLTTDRTLRALVGPVAHPDADHLRAHGAVDVLTVDDAGAPVATDATADAGVRLVATPRGIVTVRRDDPARARAWREAVRAAMVQAFDDGLRAVAVTSDDRYVLARQEIEP